MKAKQLLQNTDQPDDLEIFHSACIVLMKHAPVYHDVLVNGTLVWTRKVRAAATDGAYLYLNPDYFNSLPNHSQRAFLLGHEVGHDVLRHCDRSAFYKARGYHSMVGTEVIPWINELAQRAADEVINHDLVAHGLEFIEEGWLSPQFNRDMLMDEVYLTLYREKQLTEENEPEDSDSDDDSDDQGDPESGDSDDADDTSDTGDTDDQSDDDDSDSTDGDSDESDDESGDADSDSDAGEDESDDGEGTGKGEGDSDDSEGAGGSAGGTPEGSDHGGFDDHFEPVYEGTEEEQADAKDADKGETQRKVDQAMDNLAEQEGGSGRSRHSRGWSESGYRHSLETEASATDWRGELADVVTRAGDGGINNWAKINRRRYAVTGCITPTRKGTVNRMAVTVDMSWSVDGVAYANYINEFAALLDLMAPKSGCVVMFTNTEVVQTYEIMTGAELLDLEYPRGGGTTMSAAVDFLEENGLDVDVHLCFTDGEFFGDMDEWNKLTQAGVVIVLDRHPDSYTMRDMQACGIKYIVASDIELAS